MSSSQDELKSIVERIAAGRETSKDVEVLQQALEGEEKVSVQLGKHIVNIGQGQDIHVGDKVIHQGASVDDIRQVLLEVLQIQAHKPLTYLTGADGLGALSDVPELPVKFLPRPDDLEPLKALLINSPSQANTVTGKTRKVGIQGMGGIGKSVLAAALAREETVRRQFPNGIVWVRLGHEKTNPIDEQIKVARALTNDPQSFTSILEGKVFLENLLRDVACLLILDDVWHFAQVEAFNVLGNHCRMIITTRDAGIINGFGAQHQQLDVLNNTQALQLLAQVSEQALETLPVVALTVAEECGNLPLALAMVGAMAKGKPNLWEGLLKRLRNADLEKIKQQFPGYPYPDLLRAIQISVDALEPDQRERYLDFAVFPEDTPVPLTVLQILWEPKGLDELDVDEVVSSLANRSLIRRDNANRIILHDLQLDYVRQQTKELPVLHERLLNAYQIQCPQGWHTQVSDGYFFEWLPYHLLQANKIAELQELLLNFNWLQAKLNWTTSNALILDYDYLPIDSDLRLVQKALRLSNHILNQDKSQLAGQILGRLLSQTNPVFEYLLKQAQQWKYTAWLRPLQSNLAPPNASLLLTLEGHMARILAVAATPDGRKVVSASSDKTLKVWDLEKGVELRTLRGHDGEIYSVVVTPDGRKAVSASSDKTLKVWDLEKGVELRTLLEEYGFEAFGTAVALTPDGKWVVFAPADFILKFWSLSEEEELRTLEGVEGEDPSNARSLAITPDGTRAVIASGRDALMVWDLVNEIEDELDSGTLFFEKPIYSVIVTPDGKKLILAREAEAGFVEIWDIEQKSKLFTIGRHDKAVLGLALIPNPIRVVSASDDCTLKVWNLDGKKARTSQKHRFKITSVALSTDGRYAISSSPDGIVKVWNVEQGVASFTFKSGSSYWSELKLKIALTTDTKYAITAVSSGDAGYHTLKVWSLNQEAKLYKQDYETTGGFMMPTSGSLSSVKAVTVVPGKQHVMLLANHCIKFWDLRKGKELKTIDVPTDEGHWLAASPDGQQAVAVMPNGALSVWDLKKKKKALTLDNSEYHALFSEDSSQIEGIFTFNEVLNMTLDGQQLVFGFGSNIWVWDIGTGKRPRKLKGHDGKVTSLALSNNGKYVVSVSEEDQTLKVWDLQQGGIIASFRGDSSFSTCAISDDGMTIFAGDLSGQVHFLKLEGV